MVWFVVPWFGMCISMILVLERYVYCILWYLYVIVMFTYCMAYILLSYGFGLVIVFLFHLYSDLFFFLFFLCLTFVFIVLFFLLHRVVFCWFFLLVYVFSSSDPHNPTSTFSSGSFGAKIVMVPTGSKVPKNRKYPKNDEK